VYQCCKISCLDFGAHHERYSGTSNKLRQRIRKVRPNRNVKDVLLLHDNARPHTSLRTSEAIAKMELTVHFHPGRRPDLASSDYNLFDPG
jgi:transposase